MKYSFWKGKNVFMTGHTGFKGSWLSLILQELGANVTGFSLPAPTTPNLFKIAHVAKGMTSLRGDIRDQEQIKKAIQQTNPDILIHLAAQSLVRHSYDHPLETYSTNVMGLVHLCEAVRETPSIKSVVNVTSDKCYENKERSTPYHEDDAMGGIDPYSSSKGCAELIGSSYKRSYSLPIASARAGNVIGGGDWAKDRLIPDMFRAITKKETIYIRNPNSIRPWQHVFEPLIGYLSLAQALYEKGMPYAQGWNFGPAEQEAKSVHWIVKYISKNWGEEVIFKLDPARADFHEAQNLRLDSTKAYKELNWQPIWDLSTTLNKVIDWQLAYLNHENIRTFSQKQITEYLEKLGK
ncbi:MAG: CDP-glucose 4,6-dehydratase [Methylocystaceae bacterium]|nr:CDP-glucose 4,6-dehydratase [Methylocystaceae bacterium]